MKRLITALLVLGGCADSHTTTKDSATVTPAAAVAATDSAQDDAHRVGLTFVGYPMPPRFKWTGGQGFRNGGVRYATYAVKAGDTAEVWLATTPDTGSQAHWRVIASMIVHEALDTSALAFEHCSRDATPDSTSFALVRNDTMAVRQVARRAWHVDAGTRRFIEAPAATVECINDYAPGADDYRDSLDALANKPVLRPAADLTQLPAAARDTLTARACWVPQLERNPADNVLRGDFLGEGASSWAIWCVDRGGDEPRILVFRDSLPSPVSELESTGTQEGAHLHAYDKASHYSPFGCIGGISRSKVADDWIGAAILEGGPPLSAAEKQLPPHDGIVDGDCEGTSNIHYFTGKRWILLPGGD